MIYKRIVCVMLACFFLMASVIFPLGDISLMGDIPGMYQNYTKITSAEELGVIDFIGDYLLHGKQIFGHNERDKIPAKGNDVQFQHQASPPNVVFSNVHQVLFVAPVAILSHPEFSPEFYISNNRNKLFRPPLG